MAGFKLSAFAGMAPRMSSALLGDNEAQKAENTKLYSGELRSWNKPGVLSPRQRFPFTPKAIFRGTGLDGSAMFLAWDKDVDIVKGPINDTSDYRVYYTGDGTPKKTNALLASSGSEGAYPRDYLELGVPAPSVAPSIAVTVPEGLTPEFATDIDTYVGMTDLISVVLSTVANTQEVVVQAGTRVMKTTGVLGAGINVGQRVTGTGVQADTFVTAISTDNDDSTKSNITVSKNIDSTDDGTDTYTFTFRNDEITRFREFKKEAGNDYVSTDAKAAESRAYIYTYVSVFGAIEEESAPSPVSDIVTVRFGQVVKVKNFVAPPVGKYNIKYIRIYRTVTGSSSNPYLYVGEIKVNDSEFDDNIKAVALGEPCPSMSWGEPPRDLKGLVGMANGVLAGFVDNRLYFSEPFMPHAYPISYMLTTEYKIVGIGVFGESLAVMTEGNPYIVTGTDPSSMSMSKLPLYEPCISKRSIASDETGVMYASPNGMVLVSAGGAMNATRNMFTRKEWQVYNPQSILGRMVDGKYIGFYETYVEPLKRGAIILDRYIQQSPLSVCSFHATAAYVEPTQSSMYIAVDNEIKEWEGDLLNSLPYEWLSKQFILARPLNLGAMQVDADFGDISAGAELAERIKAIKDENIVNFGVGDLLGAINASPMNTYSMNGSRLKDIPVEVDDRYVLVTVIADGSTKATMAIKSRNAVRLPSGFKADRWEFKINGNIPLKHVKIAESSKGLVEL